MIGYLYGSVILSALGVDVGIFSSIGLGAGLFETLGTFSKCQPSPTGLPWLAGVTDPATMLGTTFGISSLSPPPDGPSCPVFKVPLSSFSNPRATPVSGPVWSVADAVAFVPGLVPGLPPGLVRADAPDKATVASAPVATAFLSHPWASICRGSWLFLI